jgi:hypothetical protein
VISSNYETQPEEGSRPDPRKEEASAGQQVEKPPPRHAAPCFPESPGAKGERWRVEDVRFALLPI